MITAVVLIDAVHDRIPEVAQTLAEIDGVSSRHDLEAAFSLGLG